MPVFLLLIFSAIYPLMLLYGEVGTLTRLSAPFHGGCEALFLGGTALEIERALVCGSSLSQSGAWITPLKNLGLIHVAVVSGLQTQALRSVILWSELKLYSVFPKCHFRNLGNGIYYFSLVAMLFVTGFSPPVLRACLAVLLTDSNLKFTWFWRPSDISLVAGTATVAIAAAFNLSILSAHLSLIAGLLVTTQPRFSWESRNWQISKASQRDGGIHAITEQIFISIISLSCLSAASYILMAPLLFELGIASPLAILFNALMSPLFGLPLYFAALARGFFSFIGLELYLAPVDGIFELMSSLVQWTTARFELSTIESSSMSSLSREIYITIVAFVLWLMGKKIFPIGIAIPTLQRFLWWRRFRNTILIQKRLKCHIFLGLQFLKNIFCYRANISVLARAKSPPNISRLVLLLLIVLSLPASASNRKISTQNYVRSDDFDSKQTTFVWNIGQGQWATQIANGICFHLDAGGELRIPPKLIRLKCRELENRVHISHNDRDHHSYLGWIKRNLKNTCAVSPLKDLKTEPEKTCSAPKGARLQPGPEKNRKHRDDNWTSEIVISGQVLSPGDSPTKAEYFWLPKIRDHLRTVRILILSHHGSKTATSANMLRAMPNLRIAIASARKAKYGHPHPTVVARLKKFGIPTISTEDWGSIQIN
jgi:competence protein ComEC